MENRNYFFRDLIVKILLILLFIFLLMWLFPMPNLNPFYDKIFASNVKSMTSAAKSYFTTSRLPENDGETKKLTLKDMLDNKMIIEFTDSNGKTCDTEKSYVEVTKKDGEYVYKTNLVCSTEEDYVIEYFGCYNVCEDGSCKNKEKEITEYQFYKLVNEKYVDKYTCKNGYTLNGTKCVASSTKVETNATLSCQEGYTLNASTNKCEKIITETSEAVKECPAGFVYASSMDKCIKGSSSEVEASVTYSCAKGTLVGTKCVVDNEVITTPTKVYSCPNGGTLSGTKCIISTTNTVPATPVYSCPNGGTLSGTKCVTSSTTVVAASKRYYCSNGTLNGTSCVVKKESCDYTSWVCSNKTYTVTMPVTSTETFTRRFLYQVGTNPVYEECTRYYNCTTSDSYTIPASIEYKCEKGELKGNECVITSSSSYNATAKYACSNGKLSGTSCIISGSNSYNATLTYKCASGTLNSNNQCVTIIKGEQCATPIYNCAVGTLEGNKCKISDVETTNTIYVCKVGTLSGSVCVITKTDIKDPIYTCAAGSTLAGTKCYKTTGGEIINATAVYKTKSVKTYKWSTSEKLEGWTRTGETRTTKVAA